jgi:dienelactone hydrolase
MTRRALLVALAAAAATTAAAEPLRQTWRDAARGRDIPILLRPAEAAGARPLVLLSHGLGGSREGLGYLGRAFAAAGFHALHLQHPGSDEALWRGPGGVTALGAAAFDPANAVARLLDSIFAVEEVLRRAAARGDPLSGRVDAARLAVAGHSFGAWTVQHLLGQRIPGGDRGLPVPERRLAAGIALSPSPPRGLPPPVAFARMTAPILHVTGTLDSGFVEGATPADREIPFRATRGAPAALAVLDGANHAAFADEAAAGPRWADPTHHARTGALCVLFLRAVLEGDPEARAALLAGAPELLRPSDRLETRGL